MQALQAVAPSVKTCSVCSESFQTKAMKNSKNTIFRDVHLQAKGILGKILPNILSKRGPEKKAVQWLTPKLSFSFLGCLDHKKQIVEYFMRISFEKYCQATLTFINRIFRGRIIPRNKTMSPPVKHEPTCYLKTQRKDERKKILNVVYSLNKATDPHVGKSAFQKRVSLIRT